MANTTNTQYMNLPLPIPTVQTGPEYASNLNSSLTLIDQHTHITGEGSPVPTAGININADLEFNGFNATEFRSTRFESQANPIALGTDLGCLYVSGSDLYYNDTDGNQIRITQGAGVAGSSGSIGGLNPPASVNYDSGSQTFVFQSTTGTAANLDAGSILIREVAIGANAVTLSSPASLASNYTLTFPTALPASTQVLAVSSAGQITASSSLTLPSQTGNSGKYLTTNGLNPSWVLLENEIRLYGSSSYGSSFTKVPLFITTVKSASTAITFIQNASSGASFLINSNGVYSFGQQMESPMDEGQIIGFSLNATGQLTTNIFDVTAAARLNWGSTPAVTGVTSSPSVAWTGFLRTGDVVRPHNRGAVPNTSNYATCYAIKIL